MQFMNIKQRNYTLDHIIKMCCSLKRHKKGMQLNVLVFLSLLMKNLYCHCI